MHLLRASLAALLLVLCSSAQTAPSKPKAAPKPAPPIDASTTQQPPKYPPVTQPLTGTLAERVAAILAQDPRAAHAMWGIEVIDAATGQPLYEQSPDELLTPASNTKLFTTATVFANLDPQYRFHTSVEAAAPPDRFGRIAGDLTLVGRGDPNLSARVLPYDTRTQLELPRTKHLDQLAEDIVRSGVKFIDGDIVGDDTFFVFERYGEAWSQDDLMWWYGAPLSALTLNDNTVVLNITPGEKPGAPVLVTLDPYRDVIEVENRATTSAAGTKRDIGLQREPGDGKLMLWGTMPLDDKGETEELAIDDPALANAQLFRRMLEERGVQVLGKTRAEHKLITDYAPENEEHRFLQDSAQTAKPPQRVELAHHDSEPLMQDLRVINKVSQNLHAEIMLRLLGKLKGPSASISGGAEVVKAFLTQAGLDPNEYVFFDGSGMSRQNLVTPRAVTKLLRYAGTQPWGANFRSTLPVAATDGSLRLRFAGMAAAGQLSAKTGTLGGVNALSGYATARSGKALIFSIIVNHHRLGSSRAEQMMDEIANAAVLTQ